MNTEGFEQGRSAFLCGKTLQQCPYNKGKFRRQWQNGWQFEKDKLND